MPLSTGGQIAQTFTIDTADTQSLPGVFLTQIGVYFKSKSNTTDIFVGVNETDNGVPNISRRVGSGRMITSNIVTSNDASAETIVTFGYPLMLQTGKTYSFTINPISENPDYEMWVAELGGTDVLTGETISTQPYAGSMYVTTEGKSWSQIQTQQIKFNLYIANFKSSNGRVNFRNSKVDYISLDLSQSGGVFLKNSGNNIQVGDIVYAANASNLSSILTTNNTIYPYGTVKYYDSINGILHLDNTNGKFTNSSSSPNYSNIRIYRTPSPANTSYITPTYLIANATIASIDDIIYHGFVPKFNVNEPVGTIINYSYLGTSNSINSNPNTKDTAAIVPTIETLYEYKDYERVVRSYSNEVAQGTYDTTGTATFGMQFVSTSQYLSPVVDLAVKNFDYIQNIINNPTDYTDEHTRFGSGKSKYISKTITLNSPAEDLKVYITGYRPAGTNIVVYGKFFNSTSDTSTFDLKDWSILSYLNGGDKLFSSPKNTEDYKEYVFGIPQSNAPFSSPLQYTAYADTIGDIANNVPPLTLTYKDVAGVTYRGFDMFSIKILLLSDDPVNYPTMRDVRAIALQI